MRPDARIRQGEAQDALRRALVDYAEDHDSKDVLLYAASKRLTWNELQAAAEMTPQDLAVTVDRVDRYLYDRLQSSL